MEEPNKTSTSDTLSSRSLECKFSGGINSKCKEQQKRGRFKLFNKSKMTDELVNQILSNLTGRTSLEENENKLLHCLLEIQSMEDEKKSADSISNESILEKSDSAHTHVEGQDEVVCS